MQPYKTKHQRELEALAARNLEKNGTAVSLEEFLNLVSIPLPADSVWKPIPRFGNKSTPDPKADIKVNPTPVTGVDATLAQRGNRYGKFTGHAKITQTLKTAMQTHENWNRLADDQKEALEMIAHKIGRILNGDPNYADSWHDIAGYAKLVDDRLSTGKEV